MEARPRRVTCDLLVRNALAVTMTGERDVIPDAAIAVDAGRIVAVGQDAETAARFDARRELDAGGNVVHPGFVDAHVHPTQHLIRWAFPESFRYEDTLAFYIDFMLALTGEDEYQGTRLAALEMVRTGTTTFIEGCGSVLEPDAAAAAVDEVGMRALLGDPYLWDVEDDALAPLKPRVPTDRRRALRLLGGQLARNADASARVRGHVTLTGHASASTELLLSAKECAEENGVVLNMHQSYTASDTSADDRLRGEHPLVHFDRAGALSEACTFAHMNVVRADEFDPIADSGMAVVWCPSASMLWGCGGTISGPHLELYRRGVAVALGSDASNYSGSLDVADQAFLALLTARERSLEPDALLADDALAMCTIHGARAAGLADEIGSLEEGKRADMVVRRADVPEAAPGLDPVRDLVLATRSRGVATVIVDGEVIVEAGRSTRVDEERVRAEAGSAARGLLARMGRA